jgi:CDP-glycerol glycerophosphotransferase (TagB/SpsB family)
MLRRYEGLSNASINSSGNYQKIFLTSDILVSDMSSVMAEYFLTGKPIIYTHRQSAFNEFGEQLSEGFYWARDEVELCRVLAGLLAGNDPLREKRASLAHKLFSLPEGGAAAAIARILKFRTN